VTVVELEVVELVGDLLAGLAREQLGVLEHRRIHLLVAEAARDGAEVAEEPVSPAHVLGIEVARAARRLERVRHAPPNITPACGTPVARVRAPVGPAPAAAAAGVC
jgi:hypothetical protein